MSNDTQPSIDSNNRLVENMVRVAFLSEEEQMREWRRFVDWNATISQGFTRAVGVISFATMEEKNAFDDDELAKHIALNIIGSEGL